MGENREHITAELVALIYETVHDPGFWPLILKGLMMEIGNTEQLTSPVQIAAKLNSLGMQYDQLTQQQLLNLNARNENRYWDIELNLLRYFKHALDLNRRYTKIRFVQDLAETFIDQLNLGVLFVDNEGQIVFKNKFADTALQGNLLSVKSNQLITQNYHATKKLLAKIHEVALWNNDACDDSTDNLAIVTMTDGGSPVTLMLSKMAAKLSITQQTLVQVVIVDQGQWQISESVL